MTQQHSLVELGFTVPTRLLRREEDLHSDILTAPPPTPHFAISAFANTVDLLDLLGYCALHLHATHPLPFLSYTYTHGSDQIEVNLRLCQLPVEATPSHCPNSAPSDASAFHLVVYSRQTRPSRAAPRVGNHYACIYIHIPHSINHTRVIVIIIDRCCSCKIHRCIINRLPDVQNYDGNHNHNEEYANYG